MDVLGYIAAICIGIVLGLIGSGGSIITVPILVYLFAVNPVLATAYSLFVVGVTAFVGTLKNIRKGLVDFKIGITFSIPAFITVYLTRRFLVPIIPDDLFYISDFLVTKDLFIMLLFALLMLVAAITIIRVKVKENTTKLSGSQQSWLIVVEGLVVGLLTGFVGAGGGFLIIPALVLLTKLPFKKAVATSLLIVAVKSLIGFLGDVQNLNIDWWFLLSFTALAVLGIGVGAFLNKFIDGKRLKKYFGWFVLIMAFYIIIKELT